MSIDHEAWTRKKLAAGRHDLRRARSLDAIDVLDESALAAALLSMAEADRVDAGATLHQVVMLEHRTDRSRFSPTHWARVMRVVDLGTKTPTRTRNDALARFIAMDADTVPEEATALFRARPARVRAAMERWWWHEGDEGAIQLWDVWRHLVRAGEVEPKEGPFELGAYRALLWGNGPEDGAERAARVSHWIAADPAIVELARSGYRSHAARQNETTYLKERVRMLVTTGVLRVDDVVAVAVNVLSGEPHRDRNALHRWLVDEVVDMSEYGSALVPSLGAAAAHGAPADRTWALAHLLALAPRDARAQEIADTVVTDVVATASVATTRAALRYAAGRSLDLRLEVIAAALTHARSSQRGLALDALATVPIGDVRADASERILDAATAAGPAERDRVRAWAGVGAVALGVDGERKTGEAASPQLVPAAAPTLPAPLVPVTAEELGGLAVAAATGGLDALDAELLLDGMARYSPTDIGEHARGAIAHRARAARTSMQPLALPCFHVAEAVWIWNGDVVPRDEAPVRKVRRLLRTATIYREDHPIPGPVTTGPERPLWEGARDCEWWGTAGLLCARLAETVIGSGPRRPALATPDASDGTVSAQSLVSRLAHHNAGDPWRYDAVAAILRLPARAPDGDVLAALRESRHPVAVAALALWGAGTVDAVPLWLRPALASRGLRPTGAEIVSRTSGWRPQDEWTALVVNWNRAVVSGPSRWDPLGSIAWWSAPGGSDIRRVESWDGAMLAIASPFEARSWQSALLAAPHDADAVLAAAAAVMVRLGLADRTSHADDAPALHLLHGHTPLDGHGASLYLATVLVGRSSSARAAVTDVLSTRAASVDGHRLGVTVAALAASVGGLARAAAVLEASVDGPAGATLVASICAGVIGATDPRHRELAALLEVWERACDVDGASSVATLDAAARRVLDDASAGSSKRAHASRRLLALLATEGTR
ncbi:hypothetical protein [Demequina sp. NBRC 110056]|uniref:hypothetical protein n=1 Tax=Demequina sp. NBRC 110056 TaxID=1570345 RepID=UPI0009FD0436|nr:hypothetical protein [Demequina sp. NBRC 110056]